MTTRPFFPRQSVKGSLEEPPALRRLSVSLPQMALITGILLRIWRSFVLTHGTPDSWLWVGGTFLAGMTFLFLMLTLHLGNFTVRRWAVHAPLFAVLEAGSEIVTSLALTAFGLEPLGSEMAEWSDWLPMATRILFWRLLGIVVFTLVLAVVVTIVRRLLLAGEHRASTVAAVHRASAASEAHTDVPSDATG